MIVKPSAEGLMSQVKAVKGPPPVHLWNPPFCGDIDIRIARDGTWFYLGTPIGRAPLVKLFASILKKEGDEYFLVTPVEKVRIKVDDAPLLAVDFTATGEGRAQNLTFTTKTEDEVAADAEHRITVKINESGEPSPYIHVRRGLNALIDRKSFYRLIELGCHAPHSHESWFGLWSYGLFFPIIRSAELP
ncbi:MAG: DUF1285 domain-containing protein [Paracoccaceae bacterium]